MSLKTYALEVALLATTMGRGTFRACADRSVPPALPSTVSIPLSRNSLGGEVQPIVSTNKAALKRAVFWLLLQSLAAWEEQPGLDGRHTQPLCSRRLPLSCLPSTPSQTCPPTSRPPSQRLHMFVLLPVPLTRSAHTVSRSFPGDPASEEQLLHLS